MNRQLIPFLFVGLSTLVEGDTPAAPRAYVTPHAVFLNPDSRAAQLTIGASGDEPEEVTIDVQFGFPDVDANGTAFVRLVEDPGPEFPSAAAWVRPFPRRVRLEPGQQQFVRLLALPPDSLPDGEYWTRVIITSRGLSAPVTGSNEEVRAGLQIVLRLITSVTFRKGDMQTGLDLQSFEADIFPDSIVAWLAAEPTGNAGYLGTATFELVDADGMVAQEWPVPFAAYYPFRRRFLLPVTVAPQPGQRLRVTVEAKRPDLEAEHVLPAPTVSDSITIGPS